ncbi:hypothetical protein NPIL_540201 [Nephila pilipes]|uniref:Uncharacterized protein n=1 Tax=Nephila pilipes TaxID=299642 RepID=A0A8X6N434_NEPPI|nr:hypothetical protein NPIL_540201 [Nephila pilipes]
MFFPGPFKELSSHPSNPFSTWREFWLPIFTHVLPVCRNSPRVRNTVARGATASIFSSLLRSLCSVKHDWDAEQDENENAIFGYLSLLLKEVNDRLRL